jgi:UDP-3-O-[3-hydroxymyristoyl] N-acetylglucosamine deacetylase
LILLNLAFNYAMKNQIQNTLKKEISYSGIALHTGVRAHLTIHPAPENSGIVFRRIDTPGQPSVEASAKNVVDVQRGTTIAAGNAAVATVEHVLASLSAYQIDNALVDMDGPEPPIGDGSALPYSEMILEAGIEQQNSLAKIWSPEAPIVNEEGGSTTIILPHDGLKISCLVEYTGTPLGTQYYSGEITKDEFRDNIASARTLCEFKDLEQLIAMGLVKGGSLDNAVVIHDGAIISKEGLRFKDELVRHKVLDIIGDMALIGCRLCAHIITIKPGHATNVMMAQEIMESMI